MNKKYKKIILIHGWGFNSSIWNNVIENSIYGSQMHPLNIYAEARESGTNIHSIANSIANKHPDLDCIVGWSMGCYFANALSKISKKLPIVYVSFLPSFDNFSELGCGFTKKEVENLYDDLNKDFLNTIKKFYIMCIGKKNINFVKQFINTAYSLEKNYSHEVKESLAFIKKDFINFEIRKNKCIFIYGDDDNLCNNFYSNKIISQFDKKIIKGGSHALFVNKNKEFIDVLDNFLKAI